LAPDLVELALQLGDDAAFLAARYPAAKFAPAQVDSAQAAVSPQRRDTPWHRRARRLSPVAAGILLAVGVGLLATNHIADAPLATENLENEILKKQPGDLVELAVDRGDQSNSTEIPLENDGPEAAQRQPGNLLVGPPLRTRTEDGSQNEVLNSQGVEEVSIGSAPAARRMARDELSMLRTQLMAFEKVIQRLQLELKRRDELQRQTETQLRELTEEVAKLRGRKSEAPEAPTDEP
jgi:hypothetical protein